MASANFGWVWAGVLWLRFLCVAVMFRGFCDSGWVADGTFACCCDLVLLFGLVGLFRGCRVVFLVISDLCGCWV